MILLKKAVRAVWGNKKAYLACVALIGIGVLVYVSFIITSNTLISAADAYYKDCRLADVFSKVKAIPVSSIENYKRMEGISDALGRYVCDLRVAMPDTDKAVTLRVVSVDTTIEGVQLNHYVYNGRDFSTDNDIMLSEDFMSAHGLKVGDDVNLVVNGKEKTFNICASAQSPEYVYAVKDEKEIIPDAETFGYGFMAQENLFALTGKFGAYNDVSFSLADGYTFENVRPQLEDELQKYELLELYAQKNQISFSVMEMELTQIKNISTSLPIVFMLIAIVVLYLMLKRVIEQDRTQIGTMKAFGYSNRSVLLHYMCYGIVTGLIGGVLGVVLGWFAADSYINLYMDYFKFPAIEKDASLTVILNGFLISISAGAAGAYFGAKSVLKLNPAEAMRPVAPAIVKFDILKRLPLLYAVLSSAGNMGLRSILRNKVRSFVVILGVMFSFGLLAFMGSASNMIDDLMINQYTLMQIFDAQIILNMPQDYQTAVDSVNRIKGVDYAEGILEIPVELKNKNMKTGVMITGIEADSTLYKIYDNERKAHLKPPTEGIILSDVLAGKLGAERGDTLYVSSASFRDDVKILVSDVVTTNLGSNGYMEINALSKFFNIKKTATTLIFKANDLKTVKTTLKNAENIAALADKQELLRNYSTYMTSFNIIFYLLEILSAAVAFAIIYNTSNIALSERKREFATLRVIGMHVTEVAEIMSFEYWTLAFAGMALGVPFTGFLKQSMASSLGSDMYTFPIGTPFTAYMIGVAGCAAAVFVSNKSNILSIKKFDIVEVLKERE